MQNEMILYKSCFAREFVKKQKTRKMKKLVDINKMM